MKFISSLILFLAALALGMAAEKGSATTNGGVGQPANAKPAMTHDDFKKRWLEARALAAEKEKLLVQEIYKKIIATPAENSEVGMKLYTNNFVFPNRRYSRHRTGPFVISVSVMVPIKGGDFTMGSPEAEKDRRTDEGPQHKVKISPFWMQQCEVTWDEFEPYMYNYETPDHKDPTYVSNYLDAVSRPSMPYVPFDRGMGKAGFPAISMTQHAANKYCEWLSAKTGHFYRLPTEAEWEYACRAGTTNAYSFGEDREKLSDYGWFFDNSSSKYQKVGKKKPNPWGLYDMHGNVAEWCLDQYAASFYGEQKDPVSVDPWNKATEPYPHIVRGGSWWDDPDQLRSAARKKSEKSWKNDPQIPQSIWYVDQADFVGFRVVRPLKVPDAEQMFRYWNSGVEHEYSGKDK